MTSNSKKPIICPFFFPKTDHLVPRCQEHRLGVIWRQEETRDPVWRLVKFTNLHYQPPFHSTGFFPSIYMNLPIVFPRTASRSLRPVTQCPPSVAMTWCTTGSKAWLSACTGTCARGRRDWQTHLTRQTQRTESAAGIKDISLHSSRVSESVGVWETSVRSTCLDCESESMCVCSQMSVSSVLWTACVQYFIHVSVTFQFKHNL